MSDDGVTNQECTAATALDRVGPLSIQRSVPLAPPHVRSCRDEDERLRPRVPSAMRNRLHLSYRAELDAMDMAKGR